MDFLNQIFDFVDKEMDVFTNQVGNGLDALTNSVFNTVDSIGSGVEGLFKPSASSRWDIAALSKIKGMHKKEEPVPIPAHRPEPRRPFFQDFGLNDLDKVF